MAPVSAYPWFAVLREKELSLSISHLTLTLIGGPTVLIEYDEFRLLTDPTLDPPGLRRQAPVRFEKTTGPSMSVEEIGRLDAVLLSHDQHVDNLDDAGRAMLPGVGVTYTTNAGAGRLGGNAVGMTPFETRTLESPGGSKLLLTATPARHGPIGVEPISGDVIGFALGIDRPGDLIYITGDTVWYEGTAEVARRFSPRIVVLFTGAAEPRGRFHMTMGSEDALEAASAFPDARLVAVHNEGWTHLKETQGQLADVFARFNLGDRLIPFEKAKPLQLDI
jgi:L-ascorbate metabolism protein UlaG (beta-lactamase superfamily)